MKALPGGMFCPESDYDTFLRWERQGPNDVTNALAAINALGTASRRCCIQAGGLIGTWARHLAVDYDRVLTFEPNPESFVCLAANTWDVPNITALPFALGAHGETEVCLFNDTDQLQNIGMTNVDCTADVSAPVMAIDALERDDVDLIYLDIEGYERRALEGARETIERCRPIIGVEHNGLCFQYGRPALAYLTEDLGYEIVTKLPNDDVILRPR